MFIGLSGEAALAPSLRGLSRDQRDWGSAVTVIGHSLSQKSKIFASSLREGAKIGAVLI